MKHGRILTSSHKRTMGLGSMMGDYYEDVSATMLHVMYDCPLVMSFWLNMVHSDKGQIVLVI